MALGNLQKRNVAFGVLTVVLIVGVVALFFFLEYRRTHVTTDDAFVDGHIHIVASKVSGTVLALHVKDNQLVKKDDPIIEIDPVDHRVVLQEAQANLEMERARLTEVRSRVATAGKQLVEIRASLDAARAALKAQEALAWKADADLKRAEPLIKEQIVTQEYYDQRRTNNDVAIAQVKSARENVTRLEGSVEAQKALIVQLEAAAGPQLALIQQKEALVEKAKLNLGYTKIAAPAEGYVTKRSAEVGNQIQAGQPLLAVVPLAQEKIWVTANYKETELKDVRPGQKVEFKVDTYPGKTFRGRVNSIMAGTGSVFSLFPPENATGNYVKIVQRIPVRISLDEGSDPDHLLRVGMSVVPTILIER
ncbi:MAG: HlyD family secretion protein [Syntrophales bacterium]|nr:HlyD family secretion protein [Syntrophales bacterium]